MNWLESVLAYPPHRMRKWRRRIGRKRIKNIDDKDIGKNDKEDGEENEEFEEG